MTNLLIFLGTFLLSNLANILNRRIIEGFKSTPKPWMVHLNAGDNICGGVLYTESLVITAAHCNMYSKRKWKAYVNIVCVKPYVCGGEKYGIIKRVNHKKIIEGKFEYDISVWWINGKSNKFTQVELDDGSELFDRKKEVKVLGWGNRNRITDDQIESQNFKVNFALTLLEANLPLVNSLYCAELFYPKFNPSTMFCMGNGRVGPGTSFGDSGGPVYRIKGDKIILMGIINTGFFNYNAEACDISTKISTKEISDFIKYYVPHFKPENIDNKGKPKYDIPPRELN